MAQIKVTLPDGSVKQYEKGITPGDIALSIGEGLFRNSYAARLDGKLIDLTTPIESDAEIALITSRDPEAHEILLHSTAHLLAMAVKALEPTAKIAIGPALENRFYYDIDMEQTVTDELLAAIEVKMKELAKADFKVTRLELPRSKARDIFKTRNEDYKVELIDDIDEADTISLYEQGDFIDLCRGPHVPSTGKIKYFKLLSSSGAYWRSDEKNKMLQRIYGTAFFDKKALKSYLQMLEEAKKWDHRKLGRELGIFTFDEEVGPGLPLWLPNGAVIMEELEKLAKATERRGGYQRVATPHVTKGILYEKSGHLAHYKDSMYPAMDVDGTDYYLKPMNCPHHHKIYASSPRSYRDLPLRLAEYGTCYRFEKSGELFGLMRVRSLRMNDAHIYCTPEQFKEEFLAVCRMYLRYLEIFGIEKYLMRLSLHDPSGLGEKYVNEPELWLETEQAVREALTEGGINFTEIPNEAAFYGPKIDVEVWSAIGREFTLATNQVDFAIPRRFGLTYVSADGSEKTPLCIHRAPLGTHERFIGFLLEHFKGDLPLWLAPVQVAVLPISDKYLDYARKIYDQLFEAEIRVTIDARAEKIGAKIRQAETGRIPIMLIAGEKEMLSDTVSVRRRFQGDLGAVGLDKFTTETLDEIKNKIRSHPHKSKE
ncbi:MAG: threonine--tRNA ligase [FCB group bacterium]|nr:threonine--tRNA ligase [FCB group bacterium]